MKEVYIGSIIRKRRQELGLTPGAAVPRHLRDSDPLED